MRRRFKAGQTIISQLPRPSSPRSGNRYEIKDKTRTGYILAASGKKPEEVPFKYIDGGCYLDGKYTPNYTLLEDSDGTYSRQNTDSDHRSDSKGSRKKAKPKAHRNVSEDSDDSDDGSESRTVAGGSKSSTPGSSESSTRTRRKDKEKSPRTKRR